MFKILIDWLQYIPFFLMFYFFLAYEVHSSLSSGRYFSEFSSKNCIILLFIISALVYLVLNFVCVMKWCQSHPFEKKNFFVCIMALNNLNGFMYRLPLIASVWNSQLWIKCSFISFLRKCLYFINFSYPTAKNVTSSAVWDSWGESGYFILFLRG